MPASQVLSRKITGLTQLPMDCFFIHVHANFIPSSYRRSYQPLDLLFANQCGRFTTSPAVVGVPAAGTSNPL